jgi:hypothetical protein
MKRPHTLGEWIVTIVVVFVAIWLIFVVLALLASTSSGHSCCHQGSEPTPEHATPPAGSPHEATTETPQASPPPPTPSAPLAPAPNPAAVLAIESASVELVSEEEGASASVFHARHRRKARVTYAASGRRCYHGHTVRYKWSIAGGTIGELKVRQFGWCARGKRITRDLGWTHSSGAWGPYCITNEDWERGWMAYPGSKYGRYHASIGVSYPWGCFGVRSGTASLRIFANGGWDNLEPTT